MASSLKGYSTGIGSAHNGIDVTFRSSASADLRRDENFNVAKMSDPLSSLATRLAYAARQLPRMAWYSGHLYVLQQFAGQARQRESESARSKPPSDPRLDQRLNADMATLLKQDLDNVLAGIYPVPARS